MLNLNFQNGQAPALNARNLNAIVESINALGYAVGGPNVASTVSAMTDTSKVYVYTGSETGYTAGNWYYYNGSAWVSGGVYQATAVETDTTLMMPGEAADSATVGQKFKDIEYVSAYDLIYPRAYINTTQYDVSIIWDTTTRTATINGTATGNFRSNLTNPAFIPVSSYANTYNLYVNQTGTDIYTDIYYKIGEDGTSTYLTQFNTSGYHSFTLPDTATHFLVRISIYSGASIENAEYSVSITDKITSQEALEKALIAIPDGTNYTQIKVFSSGEYNPPQDFFTVSPTSWTSYCLPSWFTNPIPNISTGAGIIPLKFGRGGTSGAGLIVGRDPLRLVVTTKPTATSYNAASVKMTLNEKQIAFFGDSITYGRDGSESTVTQVAWPYPKQIGVNLGIRTVNFGVGSQGYLATGSGRTAYQELQSHNLALYDYVVFAWGVNDWAAYANDDIVAAFKQCVNYLYTQNPSAVLIVIGVWNSPSAGTAPKYKYDPNYQYGPKMISLNESIKAYCEEWGFPFISMDDCPFNGKNMEQMFSNTDLIHPIQKGYNLIANWLTGKIGSLIG